MAKGLAGRVEKVTDENLALHSRIRVLERENADLSTRLDDAHEALRKGRELWTYVKGRMQVLDALFESILGDS